MKKWLGLLDRVEPFTKKVQSILFGICAFCFCLVLFAQIGLHHPAVRTVLTHVDDYEGGEKSDGIIGAGGTAVLLMESGMPSAAVDILVNGEKQDTFDQKRKEITILVPSVIEIWSHTKESVTVRIESVSEQLYLCNDNSPVEAANGCCLLGKINFR